MYISPSELSKLINALGNRFKKIALLMDAYTEFAARMSKIKNPINEVGVSNVFGIDDPSSISGGGVTFVRECEMTPNKYIDELSGGERWLFAHLYAGGFSKKLYRLYEYKKDSSYEK